MRFFSHALFAPILMMSVLLWGAGLAVFLLMAPVLNTPWLDTLLVYCFGFDATSRIYRLDSLILYLLQPPLFVAVIGFFYAEEVRRFLRWRVGKLVAVLAPLLFLTASGFVVATSEVSASAVAPRQESVQPVIRQGALAPPFSLTDHRGDRFALADQRGKVVALTFVYANCRATCPALMSRLKSLEKRFPGNDLVLAAVTLDPERDGVAALSRHAERWSLGDRWHLLTGEASVVTALLKAYGVQRQELPDGEIAHENLIQLIDKRGRLAYAYRGLAHPEERLSQSLSFLLQDQG